MLKTNIAELSLELKSYKDQVHRLQNQLIMVSCVDLLEILHC